jgi:uncharacterized protein (DUF2252 family)
MNGDSIRHPTVEERKQRGKDSRKTSPRSDAGNWEPAPDRKDPVAIIQEGTKTAIQSLVPIRYGRMSASPFTFYRGTASIMAADLAPTPSTGIKVQLCGDAHLSNFGLFGAPDRSLLFDVNDFDETLPGPWEWDLKRLVASFVLAAREDGWNAATQRSMAQSAAAAYRQAMRKFAGMDNLDVWYTRLDTDTLNAVAKPTKKDKKVVKKARKKDSDRAVRKLSEVVDGRRQIVYQPPLVVPFKKYFPKSEEDRLKRAITELFDDYRKSLRSNMQHLGASYQLVDMALKVVGVGSVGTRALTALLQGHDDDDLLFLQVKEAGMPALAEYGGLPSSKEPGRRVVEGQRLMQAASDIFLGWSSAEGYHYYFRQLWDMKGSIDTPTMKRADMEKYAYACGWTLARAHARSGDRIAIGHYLGESETFDEAMAEFAVRYADQAEIDYAKFMEAANGGRIELDTSVNK